ncbi:hypothetical protein [Acidisoma sp. C75]
MARLKKEDQPRILAMVEEERRPVREIAAAFGVTPAAIYALLGRVRREQEGAAPRAAAQAPLALGPVLLGSEPQPAEDAPAAGEPETSLPAALECAASVAPPAEPAVPEVAAPQILRFGATARPEPAAGRASAGRASAEGASAGGASAGGARLPTMAERGIGASRAKPGFGLVMRMPDGDETTTPFRSLDDLLSAIKPILRAGAGSAEPVWFSIQPLDLASLEMDAA